MEKKDQEALPSRSNAAASRDDVVALSRKYPSYKVPSLSLIKIPTMLPQWSGMLESRGANNRLGRIKDMWLLRVLALTTLLNIFLLYKWFHPQNITPLDDFQKLCVCPFLPGSPHLPSSPLSPALPLLRPPNTNRKARTLQKTSVRHVVAYKYNPSRLASGRQRTLQ